MIIVLGASGLVGGALYKRLLAYGERAAGTCCRRREPGLIPFDLAAADREAAGLPLRGASHAVFCTTAVRQIDDAVRQAAAVRAADVAGTIAAIRRISAAGVVPVYVSSDYVFDGEAAPYAEDALPRPRTQYGINKRLVEEALIAGGGAWLILRIGKVLGWEPGDGTWTTGTAEALKRGGRVRGASDQRFTPLWLDDVAGALHAAIRAGLTGLYHLAGEACSRHELGERVAEAVGAPPERVERCTLSEFGFREQRPRDTRLDGGRFREATGYRFLSLDAGMRRLREAFAAR